MYFPLKQKILSMKTKLCTAPNFLNNVVVALSIKSFSLHVAMQPHQDTENYFGKQTRDLKCEIHV